MGCVFIVFPRSPQNGMKRAGMTLTQPQQCQIESMKGLLPSMAMTDYTDTWIIQKKKYLLKTNTILKVVAVIKCHHTSQLAT